ncbi:MAG: hypothetical protein ACK5V5_06470 [Cyclobacteriaceae bacterium]|jgi:hypothetical protein|nr:hypothetical protein [Flammeovirgaceae bacterium]
MAAEVLLNESLRSFGHATGGFPLGRTFGTRALIGIPRFPMAKKPFDHQFTASFG